MSTTPKARRASLKRLLKFANAVREAGGGNPIDALMPAIPEDSEQCLIAKNLNFNCMVNTTNFREAQRAGIRETQWCMRLDDEDIRDRIAEKLNLRKFTSESVEDPKFCVVLPKEIGQVAHDFDEVWQFLSVEYDEENDEYYYEVNYHEPDSVRKQIKELWPYIDESVKEAKDVHVRTSSGRILI